eukprot:gene7016-biopygen20974
MVKTNSDFDPPSDPALGAARQRPGGVRSVAALGVNLTELLQQRRARRGRRRGGARHQEGRDADAPLRKRRLRHRLRPRRMPLMCSRPELMEVGRPTGRKEPRRKWDLAAFQIMGAPQAWHRARSRRAPRRPASATGGRPAPR